jgi:hypothetical protein
VFGRDDVHLVDDEAEAVSHVDDLLQHLEK